MSNVQPIKREEAQPESEQKEIKLSRAESHVFAMMQNAKQKAKIELDNVVSSIFETRGIDAKHINYEVVEDLSKIVWKAAKPNAQEA